MEAFGNAGEKVIKIENDYDSVWWQEVTRLVMGIME